MITSAGIVLAGTFSALAVLPLVFLTEIGFVIAFGVLLDTFVVRSIVVPALTFAIGSRDLVAVVAPHADDEIDEPPPPPASPWATATFPPRSGAIAQSVFHVLPGQADEQPQHAGRRHGRRWRADRHPGQRAGGGGGKGAGGLDLGSVLGGLLGGGKR